MKRKMAKLVNGLTIMAFAVGMSISALLVEILNIGTGVSNFATNVVGYLSIPITLIGVLYFIFIEKDVALD